MDTLTENEMIVQHIVNRLIRTQEEVWEAYETTYMSDAKSAVYSLLQDVNADQILCITTKKSLLPYLNEAWAAITSLGSTHSRAQNSHACLAKAEDYLRSVKSA